MSVSFQMTLSKDLISQEQINKTIQEISNNAIELQKNVFDTYQSSYAQFFDNINNNNSYWNNFNIPQRYSETYNTLNKNIEYAKRIRNLQRELGLELSEFECL